MRMLVGVISQGARRACFSTANVSPSPPSSRAATMRAHTRRTKQTPIQERETGHEGRMRGERVAAPMGRILDRQLGPR